MLASLLPGLRQLRTPLAVGYLWLLNLWLIFADYLPRQAPDGLIGNVFELAGILGDATVLAAISFSAYLLGSMSVLVPTSLLSVMLIVKLFPVWPFQILTVSFLVSLSDLWEAQGRHGIKRPGGLRVLQRKERNTAIRPIVKEAFIQRHDLRTKLLMKDMELYNEYDRLVSEAEFRLNVAVPLAALCCILAFYLNPLWLLGLAPVALIFGRGTTRAFDALAVLIRAILDGKIRASEYLFATAKESELDKLAAQHNLERLGSFIMKGDVVVVFRTTKETSIADLHNLDRGVKSLDGSHVEIFYATDAEDRVVTISVRESGKRSRGSDKHRVIMKQLGLAP